MRNLAISAIILASLAIYSCASSGGSKLRGDGNVTKESREIFSFNKIKIEGVINVILIKGDHESALVEADENLQPYIHVYTTGKTLVIDTEDENNYKFTKNNVYITYTALEEVVNDGVGNLTCENPVTSETLTLHNNGVGHIDLDLNCNRVDAEQNGVGSLKLKGSSVFLDLENNGVGSVNSSDLMVDYVSVDNSGVGSTHVYANKEISISSSGIGSVKYSGDAVVKKLDSSGIGSVKRVD